MALFNRKPKDSVLPEVDQYYQAERRDRGVLAWLLALASIAVVALIIVLLFLGGRWVYRQITKDETETVTVEENPEDTPSIDGGSDSNEGTDGSDSTDGSGDESADQNNTGQTGSTDQNSTDSDQGSSEGNTSTPAQNNTPTTTPTTGDDDLPNTGPGDMVAVFAGVTTLAGGIHYTVSRKRFSRN